MNKTQELLDPKEIGTAKRPKTPKPVSTVRESVIRLSGIYGLVLFLVCLSILYMAYLVIMGTDDMVSKYLTAPALGFVAYFLVVKAVK